MSSKRLAPVIDRNRCEGKAECVRVCPFDVFTIGRLEDHERRGKGDEPDHVEDGPLDHIGNHDAYHVLERARRGEEE